VLENLFKNKNKYNKEKLNFDKHDYLLKFYELNSKFIDLVKLIHFNETNDFLHEGCKA